jgi:hypothetical protein
MAPESPEFSDAEKRQMRSGLAECVGALMRAWWLGMFRARDDAEQQLLDEIGGEIALDERPGDYEDATPLGLRTQPDPNQEDDLVLLTDEEYQEAFADLVARYVRLRNAYRRGMVVAENVEQEKQLDELRNLLT